MKTKILLLSIISIATLSACNVVITPSTSSGGSTSTTPSSSDTNTNTNTNTNTGSTTTSSTDDGRVDNVVIGKNVALTNSQDYIDFWAPTSVVSFDFKMEQKAYEYLEYYSHNDRKQYEDYYFPATVTIHVNDKTYTFEEAGLRRKGNMSRGDDFSNGRIHYKLSFKETFDEDFYKNNCPEIYHDWTDDTTGYNQRGNRTFCDMEKVDLKWNRNYDATNLRQAYANKIFRDKGLIAQQATIGTLNFYQGDNLNFTETYDVLECVDKVMMKRYFSKASAKGDLYKMSWRGDFVLNNILDKDGTNYKVKSNVVGVSDPENWYNPQYDLKTNKKSSTHADFINFIKTINNDKTKGEAFDTTLYNLVDLDYTARFLTYSWAVGDPDDIRCNYNNTYIYFEPTTHKMYLIPYDHDRSLGITKDGCGLLPAKRMTTTKCTGYGGDDNFQENPFFWRTCIISTNSDDLSKTYAVSQESLTYIKQYMTSLKTDSLFTVDGFNSYINQFSLKGENASYSDSNNQSFEAYANNLQSKIAEDNNYLFA